MGESTIQVCGMYISSILDATSQMRTILRQMIMRPRIFYRIRTVAFSPVCLEKTGLVIAPPSFQIRLLIRESDIPKSRAAVNKTDVRIKRDPCTVIGIYRLHFGFRHSHIMDIIIIGRTQIPPEHQSRHIVCPILFNNRDGVTFRLVKSVADFIPG